MAKTMLNSAANALRVLEHLVDCGEVGVSDIGRHIGVTVGTAHRLVATLVETGFAEQNRDNRRYRPGGKVLALAQKMRSRVDVGDLVHDHLVALMCEVHETVNLAVLDNGEVLYLDKVISDQPFGIEARVGSRLPAHRTALGKAMMAHQSGRAPRKALREVREQGFAEDHGEYLPDVYCVSAPVLTTSDIALAAVSISAPRSRFHAERDNFVVAVQRTASDVSALLRELGITELPR